MYEKRANQIKVGDKLMSGMYVYDVTKVEVYPSGRINITDDTGYSKSYKPDEKLWVFD